MADRKTWYRRADLTVLPVFIVAAVGICIYVIATGRTDSPWLTIGITTALVVISILVTRLNLRERGQTFSGKPRGPLTDEDRQWHAERGRVRSKEARIGIPVMRGFFTLFFVVALVLTIVNGGPWLVAVGAGVVCVGAWALSVPLRTWLLEQGRGPSN